MKAMCFHNEELSMNHREPINRDPRRGLPNMAERQKTNVPAKENETDVGERKAIERAVRDFDR